MPAGSVSSRCELSNAPTCWPVSALSTACDASQVADVVRSFPGFGFAGSATTRLLAGVERGLERVRQLRPDRRVEIGTAGRARDGLQLPARRGIDDEADGVNGDALGGERLGRHHRIALAGLLAVADEDDDALLGIGREIVRRLSQRIGDRRVALGLRAIDRRRDRGAAGARRTERHAEMRVLAILLRLAADCAPYIRSDSCACAGMKPATPLIARCATAMRVSPFGSLAFMLPEASRINRIERSAVLQVWASVADGISMAAQERSASREMFRMHASIRAI